MQSMSKDLSSDGSRLGFRTSTHVFAGVCVRAFVDVLFPLSFVLSSGFSFH